MFELETNITKEFILSKVSQEQIFEHYGISVKKGLFCSPSIIRVDKQPTCSFYKNNKGDLIYKDFAGPSFNVFSLVMFLFNCSYYKALKIIANDFNLVSFPKIEKNIAKIEYTGTIIKETEKSKITVEIKDFTEKELEWWNSFGISLKTLEKFKVYSIKSIFLNGNYFDSSTEKTPVYGYFGGFDSNGDELWRLYFPTKRKFRFLSNWSKSLIQGSKQIPKNGDFIVITKSLKDVMALWEFGIIAVAPNSENLFLTEKQYAKLKLNFKKVFLLYDLDLAGIKASKRIRKEFPDIQILFMPYKSKCKDFSDYVKKHKTTTVFKLIDKAKEYYLK